MTGLRLPFFGYLPIEPSMQDWTPEVQTHPHWACPDCGLPCFANDADLMPHHPCGDPTPWDER
jgi:hypothetical protein